MKKENKTYNRCTVQTQKIVYNTQKNGVSSIFALKNVFYRQFFYLNPAVQRQSLKQEQEEDSICWNITL